MTWIYGVLGGFILFLYGVIPTFQSTHFHRIYAAYGGIFIAMALLWGRLCCKPISHFCSSTCSKEAIKRLTLTTEKFSVITPTL